MGKKFPNIFIVGMQKCGTESLKDWLNQHPDIWMDHPYEPNYFADDVQGCEEYTSFENYLALFPNNTSHKYIGEKSARYLPSNESAQRIHQYNPEAKIIIILRNPYEMTLSHFNHLRQQGLESLPTLQEAWEAEQQRRKKYGTTFIRNFYYRHMIAYYDHVKRYVDYFKENVKIILLDDLKKDPQKTYDALTDFLEIPRFTPNFEIKNVGQKKPRSQFHAQVFYFLQNTSPTLRRMLKRITSHNLRTKTKNLLVTQKRGKDVLDKSLKNEILASALPQTKLLEKLLGVNLKEWYPISD